MKNVLIAGSLNMDLVVKVPRFPNAGETITGLSFTEHIGGKGANQASACALQGVSTTMWGCIGNDGYGDTIIKALKKLSITTSLSKESTHTGLALIELSPEGQNRIVVIPSANGHFTKDKAKQDSQLIAKHDIIVLQHEIPLETCIYIAEEARKQGKTIILNPAPALAIPDSLLKNIDYLIPNEHELCLITSQVTETPEQIENAMLHLIKKGVGCVITTLGSKGICFYKDTLSYINAPKVQVIDSTGAGDAFVGAFAAYLSKGISLEQSLKRAVYAASLSVTRFGAFSSSGTKEEIEKLIHNEN